MPPKRNKRIKKTESNKEEVVVKSKYFKHSEEEEDERDKDQEKEEQEDLEETQTTSTNDKWMPKNWEQILENIREMRKNSDAPVDSMGCHKCHDDKEDPKTQRYQSLIALMLSAQTKDEITHSTMLRLRNHGLSVENILKTSESDLGELIKTVGFWKRKASFIKKTTQILQDKYDGDIPDNIKELCDLPGVGPKMAHICMNIAWDKVTGIGVDTHVHRISNRLGWTRKKTSTPEATRKELEDWLPESYWKEVNHILVGFGQTICRPVGPKCDECLNKKICPFGRSNKKK